MRKTSLKKFKKQKLTIKKKIEKKFSRKKKCQLTTRSYLNQLEKK